MVNIKYVKHKDIDKVKWDACIDNAPNALIYAYSYYLDVKFMLLFQTHPVNHDELLRLFGKRLGA